jgi:hypothetical protein
MWQVVQLRYAWGFAPWLGEDGIYLDHRADCRDSVLHKTCAGRWRGVVSLGFDADGT